MAKILLLLYASFGFHLPFIENRTKSDYREYFNRNDTIVGKVIKILDGETYDILTSDKKTIRIRMAGIDAPEKGQAYYRKAKEFLSLLCFKKEVRVKKTNTDQYGRIIAW